MKTSLCLLALGALALAAPAFAGYPTTFAAQGGPGIVGADGTVHYVAYKQGADTKLAALAIRDDAVLRSTMLDGPFGVPMLGNHNVALGMFRDGSAFVLQSVGYGASTAFRVVRTSDLGISDTISLQGTFAFDALSPDGKTLYLIQHTSLEDIQHYVVRAYDLATHALRPGRIADKAQKSWVMSGWPSARTETANGRWVYTLYANPGGFPFVHALDTVRGVAHCVGIAWRGDQGPLFDYRLEVRGNRLLVQHADRSLYRAIDRTTWAVKTR
jgi:hypothetical protein